VEWNGRCNGLLFFSKHQCDANVECKIEILP
jgi:hypothetical protein